MKPHERWNLADFLEQIRQVRALPNLVDLIRRIPGGKRYSISEDELRQAEAIILSMTPQERRIPERIGASRVRRIAKGSGTTESDVLRLLHEFRQMGRQ